MEKSFEIPINKASLTPVNSLLKRMAWGLIGGLAGTLIMDLILMGVFFAFGLPALTCFSIIGNTVAHFFWTQSVEIADAIQIGIVTHYIVGPAIGLIFGSTVVRFKPLRVNTVQKCILAAILYIEVLSQPLLALSPILLKMPPTITLLWYCGSFVIHLIAALVMGLVVGHGLHLAKEMKRI